MTSRPKRRQVGTAGLLVRFRDGTCEHTCRRCGQWDTFPGWRAALRAARGHAGDHHAADVRYNLAVNGVNALERPRTTRRRSPLRRLAAALVVLLLAAVAFFGVAGLTGRAAPAPPVTTAPAPQRPARGGYVPHPAGPPATDQGGQWTTGTAPAGPHPSSSSSATPGGGR